MLISWKFQFNERLILWDKGELMKARLFFAWYDFWVGWFYDKVKTKLYICLLPMIVLEIEFIFCYQVIGYYIQKPMGYCWGYKGKQDVLLEEPLSTFKRISKKQYIKEHENE
jgi:hypothetical protein